MRSYVEASKVFATESLYPLAAVDCYDWTDVCGKNNVSIYPSVRIYRKERTPVDYKSILGAGAIVSTVKLWVEGRGLSLCDWMLMGKLLVLNSFCILQLHGGEPSGADIYGAS